MAVKRYRKKPIEVEALQWTGDNREEVADFLGDQVRVTVGGAGSLNTWMGIAVPGDYLVRTSGDGFVVRSKRHFEEQHELASDHRG